MRWDRNLHLPARPPGNGHVGGKPFLACRGVFGNGGGPALPRRGRLTLSENGRRLEVCGGSDGEFGGARYKPQDLRG